MMPIAMAVETFYSLKEMKDLGLKEYGRNVHISRKSSIYNPEKVTIGNDVRIDDGLNDARFRRAACTP